MPAIIDNKVDKTLMVEYLNDLLKHTKRVEASSKRYKNYKWQRAIFEISQLGKIIDIIENTPVLEELRKKD